VRRGPILASSGFGATLNEEGLSPVGREGDKKFWCVGGVERMLAGDDSIDVARDATASGLGGRGARAGLLAIQSQMCSPTSPERVDTKAAN
jgi:hypothetical protein